MTSEEYKRLYTVGGIGMCGGGGGGVSGGTGVNGLLEDIHKNALSETGIVLLLTPTEPMANRYVPLGQDPAVATLRDKIQKAAEVLG